MIKRNPEHVLREVSKKIKNADKVNVLREHASPALLWLLHLAYGEGIKWLLPEGAPPYKIYQGRPNAAPSDLLREMRRLYLFLEGGAPQLARLRREKLFQDILEGINKEEGELLIALKDGRLDKQYKCPKKVVEEAFPGLLSQPCPVHFMR